MRRTAPRASAYSLLHVQSALTPIRDQGVSTGIRLVYRHSTGVRLVLFGAEAALVLVCGKPRVLEQQGIAPLVTFRRAPALMALTALLATRADGILEDYCTQ